MTAATASLAPQTIHTTYPLRALLPSPENVRRKPRPADAVMSMALSIHAHGGLLQNLVVVPEVRDGRRTGRAEVAAGETRRQALCLLRDGGVPGAEGFDDDFAVPVLEVDSAEAAVASASENMQRTPMHPADQFEAFQTLHEQCGSIEHVAAVFGVSELMVRQRLRLAAASPTLFALYRDDGMTLEQLMALSVTDDPAAQERVWAATQGRDWERTPQRLRQTLLGREPDTRSPLVRLVTLAAYEAAGGAVRADLFGDEGTATIVDVELLERLADDKLAGRAEAVRREGWSWVEVRREVVHDYDLGHHGRARRSLRTLNADEQQRLEALRAQHDAAQSRLDAHDDDGDGEDYAARRALVAEVGQLHRQVTAMEEGFLVWAPEVMALSGALVALDPAGKAVVHRGLVKPENRKALQRLMAGDPQPERGAVPSVQGHPDASEGSGPGMSEALMWRLTAHRTAALRRALVDAPKVALVALVHSLVQQAFEGTSMRRSALDLALRDCAHRMRAVTESSVEASRAWQELQALRSGWGERLPGEPERLLAWLLGQPLEQLLELLALCVASSVDALQGRAGAHAADALAQALGLDMADWWEPTAAEYLSRVPKALVEQALAEAGLADEAAAVQRLRKGEAVARAEVALAGQRWLPQPLRFGANGA